MARWYASFDNVAQLTLEERPDEAKFLRLPYGGPNGPADRLDLIAKRKALHDALIVEIGQENNNNARGIIVPNDVLVVGASTVSSPNLYTSAAAVRQEDPSIRPPVDIVSEGPAGGNALPVSPAVPFSIAKAPYQAAVDAVETVLGRVIPGDKYIPDMQSTLRTVFHDAQLAYIGFDTLAPDGPGFGGDADIWIPDADPRPGQQIGVNFRWQVTHPNDKHLHTKWTMVVAPYLPRPGYTQGTTGTLVPQRFSGTANAPLTFVNVNLPDGMRAGWTYIVLCTAEHKLDGDNGYGRRIWMQKFFDVGNTGNVFDGAGNGKSAGYGDNPNWPGGEFDPVDTTPLEPAYDLTLKLQRVSYVSGQTNTFRVKCEYRIPPQGGIGYSKHIRWQISEVSGTSGFVTFDEHTDLLANNTEVDAETTPNFTIPWGQERWVRMQITLSTEARTSVVVTATPFRIFDQTLPDPE